MDFPRQEYWTGLSFHSPGNLPDPGIEPKSPALAGRFITSMPPESLMFTLVHVYCTPQFSSVQSLSRVRLFATPWIAARQGSLSITNSWSLLKFMSVESMMQYNHFILYRHLLLLPSIFPSIRVFSNESTLCMRWPKCWSFSFSISPSNEYLGLISFRVDWLALLAVQGTLKSLLQTTVQKHQFFDTHLSL